MASYLESGTAPEVTVALTARRVTQWRRPESLDEAFLDLNRLPEKLVVRNRRDADRDVSTSRTTRRSAAGCNLIRRR